MSCLKGTSRNVETKFTVIFPVNKCLDTVWIKAYFNTATFTASLFVLECIFSVFFGVYFLLVVASLVESSSTTECLETLFYTGFPHCLESPGIPGPAESWKMSLVLEKPGN